MCNRELTRNLDGHREFEMTLGLNMSITVDYMDDYGYIPLQSHEVL